jgi:hypothetical protein
MATAETMKNLVESITNGMVKANQKYCSIKGQPFDFSENMQYLIMYILGIFKSQLISFPNIINPIDTLDKIAFLKFQVNNLSADEIQPLFSP